MQAWRALAQKGESLQRDIHSPFSAHHGAVGLVGRDAVLRKHGTCKRRAEIKIASRRALSNNKVICHWRTPVAQGRDESVELLPGGVGVRASIR